MPNKFKESPEGNTNGHRKNHTNIHKPTLASWSTRQAVHTKADEHCTRIKQLSQDANSIIVYTDGLVAAITNEKPGPSQQISQIFVETATHFLDENRTASIEVAWGHSRK